MSDPDLKSLLEKLTEVCLQNQDLQKEQQVQQKELQDLVKTITTKPILAPPKLTANSSDNKKFLIATTACSTSGIRGTWTPSPRIPASSMNPAR